MLICWCSANDFNYLDHLTSEHHLCHNLINLYIDTHREIKHGSSFITLPAVSTSIQTAYTTQTATPSTIFVYQTVTVATSGAVQTVSAPVPNFKLAMVPVGGGTTLYMEVLVGDALAYKSTTDITQASVFTIDTLNRLVTTAADPEIACAYSSISNYYMEGLRHTWFDAHTQYFTPLSCAVNSDLTLTCSYKTATSFTYYASQQSFFYSTAGYDGFPTYIANVIPQ
ncbi:uncharacterized protein LY89DRAFT_228685 [Mollisia scopiformis]|uniref:Uncharacterized protein n=1 Tax=Mollisia scopiformis TaxID=149040 RepID=A0A194WVD7_MOLSC|nr:uncharacterized protein LY89DRAFT_228685 [Mollisia scopiformis]KUJ11634.1 hypothetical protein LY89DRAFT_228685 [Mollisia scopiformis]